MIHAKLAATIAVALLFVGCSSDSNPPADTAAAPPDNPIEPTVFDPMVQSLDKARGVEEKVMQRAGDLRSRVDEVDDQDDP